MLLFIHFASPWLLLLLILIPAAIVWYILRHRKLHPEISIPTTGFVVKGFQTLRQRFFHGLFVLRVSALTLIIIALARPQSSTSRQDVTVEGIDIVLALDVSGSMLAEDFKPNRLEAAKDVARDFLNQRPNDRIGLVIFSGEAFTQCPLTSDRSFIINMFGGIKSGMLEDGTALGDGLATAVNRLKKSKAVSKVIILLTDGVNNRGAIDPLTAAEIAKLFKVRVYTIGVGTRGLAPYPFQTPFGIQYQNVEVEIDEPLLTNISDMTDGKYFRATNKNKLIEIFSEIDKMEKSKIDVTEYRKKHEEFLPLVLIAFGLVFLELILKLTVYRYNP